MFDHNGAWCSAWAPLHKPLSRGVDFFSASGNSGPDAARDNSHSFQRPSADQLSSWLLQLFLFTLSSPPPDDPIVYGKNHHQYFLKESRLIFPVVSSALKEQAQPGAQVSLLGWDGLTLEMPIAFPSVLAEEPNFEVSVSKVGPMLRRCTLLPCEIVSYLYWSPVPDRLLLCDHLLPDNPCLWAVLSADSLTFS